MTKATGKKNKCTKNKTTKLQSKYPLYKDKDQMGQTEKWRKQGEVKGEVKQSER